MKFIYITSKMIKITLIFQLLMVISISFAITRHTDLLYVWSRYETSYNRRQTDPDPFCDADLTIKTAICDIILREIEIEYNIYLNKSAIFYSWIECENHNIITDPIEGTKTQRIFPCYGRHNPMQTGWGVDDYFKYIYVSGGPNQDSIFVYHRERTPEDDEYYLWEMIDDIGLPNLQSITISDEDTDAEFALLQNVTITTVIRIIEVNYIRNIIKKEYINSALSICKLSKQQKLQVCKIVVQQIKNVVSDFASFVLIEHVFGLLPVKCTKKKIKFSYYEPNEEVKRKMFTCYGYFAEGNETAITRLQLSDGYYFNTILALIISENNNDYPNFQASIHNINIETIQPAYIPPPPPPLPHDI